MGLFGSIGKSVKGFLGGEKQATGQQNSSPWGPQAGQLKYLFREANDLYRQRKAQDVGDQVALFDPGQSNQLTQNFLNGQLGELMGSTANAMKGLQGSGGTGAAGLSGALDVASSLPRLTQDTLASLLGGRDLQGQIDAASRDVVRNLNEEVLPGLNDAASVSGNMNSSRAGVAEGIARRGAADRVGDIAAAIRSDAYNTALGSASNMTGNQLQGLLGVAQAGTGAAGTVGSLMQGLTGAAAAGQNMGLTAAQAETQGAQSAIDNREAQLAYQTRLLQDFQNLVGGQQWGGQTSTKTIDGGGSGQMLGNILGMGAQAAALFSDRRLKRDITFLGTAPGGLDLYAYEYVWGGGRQVGVMAQDLVTRRPDAVLVHPSGYLMVDYSKLQEAEG
ncbi:MAG: tail fiber domain-containing protein [Geminicoccaceae bacterium]